MKQFFQRKHSNKQWSVTAECRQIWTWTQLEFLHSRTLFILTWHGSFRLIFFSLHCDQRIVFVLLMLSKWIREILTKIKKRFRRVYVSWNCICKWTMGPTERLDLELFIWRTHLCSKKTNDDRRRGRRGWTEVWVVGSHKFPVIINTDFRTAVKMWKAW